MEKTDVNNTAAMAIFFVATAVILIGGLGVTVSQQAAFADKPSNPHKVTYCHNGHAISTDTSAFGKHVVQHGDEFSFPC